MTDNMENHTLAVLQAIQVKLVSMENQAETNRNELRQGIQLLNQRMTVFEKHMAALVSSSVYHEERYATLESRLDRIEKRLELAP